MPHGEVRTTSPLLRSAVPVAPAEEFDEIGRLTSDCPLPSASHIATHRHRRLRYTCFKSLRSSPTPRGFSGGRGGRKLPLEAGGSDASSSGAGSIPTAGIPKETSWICRDRAGFAVAAASKALVAYPGVSPSRMPCGFCRTRVPVHFYMVSWYECQYINMLPS